MEYLDKEIMVVLVLMVLDLMVLAAGAVLALSVKMELVELQHLMVVMVE